MILLENFIEHKPLISEGFYSNFSLLKTVNKSAAFDATFSVP